MFDNYTWWLLSCKLTNQRTDTHKQVGCRDMAVTDAAVTWHWTRVQVLLLLF